MGGTIIDLIWIFSVLFGIVYGRFVAHDVGPGEFWICLVLLYVGGQWILDRRAQIIIDEKDVEDALRKYLDDKE